MATPIDKRPLWYWRATRRLSKTALAEAAGVSRMTISKIESGRRESPDLKTMRAIACVFGVGLDAIDWEAGKRERDEREEREERDAKTLAPVA